MTIGVMSCGQIATPCKRMADAAVEAVEAMGYKAIMTDGALSPPGYTKAIMELIDKKVDLIIASVAAAATVPEAYKAAEAAGIPLVCLNCSNAALPSDLKADANADADAIAQGKQMANYAISESDGDVKAVVYTSTPTTSIKTRSDSAIETLEACASCTILDVKEIPLVPEQQQIIRDEVTSILQQYGPGEINYIVGGADFPIIGAIEAITALGRDDVKVVSVGCDPQNIDIIRNAGPQIQCSDDPLEWMGWASADLAGRILAGQPVTDVLLPAEFVTATVNLPPAGTPTPVLPDYRAIYKAQWGVS
jgi:ABC-type sugar transport system substrate-binding protein